MLREKDLGLFLIAMKISSSQKFDEILNKFNEENDRISLCYPYWLEVTQKNYQLGGRSKTFNLDLIYEK